MSPLAPETATAPVSQAPPDRPTRNVEQVCQELIALCLADRVLDDHEKEILYSTFQVLSEYAANNGTLGAGRPQVGAGEEALPQSPMEMNSQTEDMNTVEGAEPTDEENY